MTLRSPQVVAAAIGLAAVGVYLNALPNGFVFDDLRLILANPWLGDWSSVPEVFSSHVGAFDESIEGGALYYCPMVHLLLMMGHSVFGAEPWGFHLLNVLLHAGVSALVFLAARRVVSGAMLPAFAAGLLFAVHPIHTEVVAWVSGIVDLSCTFLSLLAFLYYARHRDQPGHSVVPSLVCFFLAALCKEPALTLPAILVAYDRFVLREPLELKRYTPYATLAGIYLLIRIVVLSGAEGAAQVHDMTAYEYALNVIALFSAYVWKLLLPVGLNAVYEFHPVATFLNLHGAISLFTTALFVALMLFARKRNPIIFFGLVMMTLPLLPALYLPGLGEVPFAERYLYWPSVGFLFAGIECARLLAAKLAMRSSTLAAATLALVTIFYAAGTVARNPVWRDSLSLWEDTAAKSPSDYRVLSNLGNEYIAQGRFDDGIRVLNDATRVGGDGFPMGHMNLGTAYASSGRFDEAIASYRAALRIQPDFAQAAANLGNAYVAKGVVVLTALELAELAELKPDDARLHNRIGAAYAALEMADEAIRYYQSAMRLDPNLAEPHNNIGSLYGASGEFDKAIAAFENAIQRKPEIADFQFNLGLAYRMKGRNADSIVQFEKVLSLRPDHEGARGALDRARGL